MSLSEDTPPTPLRRSRAKSYADGYRYCSRCRMFYLTNSIRCPYCRIPLRITPRKKRRRVPLRAVAVAEDILREVEEVMARAGRPSAHPQPS